MGQQEPGGRLGLVVGWVDAGARGRGRTVGPSLGGGNTGVTACLGHMLAGMVHTVPASGGFAVTFRRASASAPCTKA